VGQNNWEEVNFQSAFSIGGENYGWRKMEGNHCFNPASDCNDGTLTLPVVEYDHTQGCSVTGGFRYRGKEVPPQTIMPQMKASGSQTIMPQMKASGFQKK
jgi:hypothetical protein